jgi:hypothetical protein
MYTAKRIKCHVYLENVEIDFQSVSIFEQRGAPPKATINVPPVKDIFNLLPKTIGIVTADLERRNTDGKLVLTSDGKTIYDETVIFFGEFAGTGMSRSAGGAEVQLIFDGFLGNWETNPIVPVDASLPSASQAVILGINYLSQSRPTGLGMLYNRFPTMLLSFVNFFDKTDESSAIKATFMSAFPPSGGRDTPKKHLKSFWKDAIPATPKHGSRVGAELQNALAVTTRNFLLNYGMFLHSQVKSLLLDGMINYVGSDMTQGLASNIATIMYLKEKARNLVTEGSMSITSALNSIVNNLNYTYQEFAAPIITVDSMKVSDLCSSKILFQPIATMMSPIVNNVLFDDDIISMNTSRLWANEPTRVIYMGDPLMTSNDQGQSIAPMLLATIAPSNVVVGKAIGEISTLSKDQLKIISDETRKSETAERSLAKALTTLNKNAAAKPAVQAEITKYTDLITRSQGAIADQQKIMNTRALPFLKLSPEELIRGVVPVTVHDTAGLEEAFLLTVLNKKLPKEEPTSEQAKAALVKASIPVDSSADVFSAMGYGANGAGNDQTQALMSYYVQLANLDYREKRRASRGMTVQTVFSPYRICGVASLIMLKDIGPVVGVLNSNQVTITAQGETSQYLSFSHISILRLVNAIGGYADALDNFTDDLPPYLKEFSVDKVGEGLYVYMNGRSNSSLYDFCLNTQVLSTAPTDMNKATLVCAEQLEKVYQAMQDHNNIDSFIHQLTYRRFILFRELMAVLSESSAKLTPRPATMLVSEETGPRPFIKERQDVVLQIFKAVDPQIAPWKEV